MDDSDRDHPAAANDHAILEKLARIVVTWTAEYPKFIEQKMASNTDEIRYGYRGQGR